MEGEISRVFPPKTKKKKAEKNYTLKKRRRGFFFSLFFFTFLVVGYNIVEYICIYAYMYMRVSRFMYIRRTR